MARTNAVFRANCRDAPGWAFANAWYWVYCDLFPPIPSAVSGSVQYSDPSAPEKMSATARGPSGIVAGPKSCLRNRSPATSVPWATTTSVPSGSISENCHCRIGANGITGVALAGADCTPARMARLAMTASTVTQTLRTRDDVMASPDLDPHAGRGIDT